MTALSENITLLIADIGENITLRKYTGAAYDINTDTVAVSTDDISFKALVLSYKNNERDGTTILAGDRKVVLNAAGAVSTPEPNDVIILNSVAHRVVAVQSVKEAGADLIYTCQVRK